MINRLPCLCIRSVNLMCPYQVVNCGRIKKNLSMHVRIAVAASSSWTYGMPIVCIISHVAINDYLFNISKGYFLQPTNKWHASHRIWSSFGSSKIVSVKSQSKVRMVYECVLNELVMRKLPLELTNFIISTRVVIWCNLFICSIKSKNDD